MGARPDDDRLSRMAQRRITDFATIVAVTGTRTLSA